MVSLLILGIFATVVIYWVFKFCVHRPESFPPGPFRIPIVGSYFLLLLIDHKNLHLAAGKLCKFFKSSVIGFYTGDSLTVVATDPKSIREVFSNHDFDGRNDLFIGRLREPNFKVRGIFFSEGDFWKRQRRFSLRHLRDFGFGRRFEDYEIEVEDELRSLVDMIKEGKPINEHEKEFLRNDGELLLPKALIGSLSNCFFAVLCGEKFLRVDQAQVFKAGQGSMDFQIYSNEYGKLLSFVPWIRFVFPKLSSFNKLRDGSMEMCKLMEQVIEKQRKTYEKGRIRNFIDLYIREIQHSIENDEKNGFSYDQLLMICTDFLFPSLSAIEATISFLLKNLLYRKDILRNIQHEIDNVVGSERLPKLDDRVNLPYTEATLREIMRFETLVPMSVPHRTMCDTTLAGYKIPSGSIVLASIYALHNNKEIWGDPSNFRPERFLNKDGKIDLKKDFSLPFGAGWRLCAGETFARNTMFLCIATLLQNFDIFPVGEKLPDLNDNYCGLARIPRDFWIKMKAR